MSQFSNEYKTFFESPAGKQCLTNITSLIDSNHKHAEDDPELARDYMQRAKGNREILSHINSVMIDMRTNPYSKAKSEQNKLP